MKTALNNIIQPGAGAAVHTKDLHQNIASSLGQMQGDPVDPKSLVPGSDQVPHNPLEQIINPETEADMEDFMAGMKGRPRTEPSKNFLKTFLGRLKKKNPESNIKEGK